MQEPKSVELLKLLNLINNRATVFKKKSGLTVNALSILFVLQKDKNMMQKDIAEYIGISKATVGIELRVLEQKGFIERTQGDQDAREMRVNIANAGLVQYGFVVRDLESRLKHVDVIPLVNELESVFINLWKE